MNDGDFVTVQMLCQHTGRHPWTIKDALKRGGVAGEPIPTNKRTKRFRRREANEALKLHWPDYKPLPHPGR